MRALVQRVSEAAVDVAGVRAAEIREVLCLSQFTLYGDTRRGNRPSYGAAAAAELAEPLYERFRERLGATGGVFGAHMRVSLVNDGPVTLMLEV